MTGMVHGVGVRGALRRAKEMRGLYASWPTAWRDRAGLGRGAPVAYRVRLPDGAGGRRSDHVVLRAEANGHDVCAINEVWLGDAYTGPVDDGRVPPVDDTVVVDLGANRGFFSVFASRVLGAAHVICVEPEPANLALLEANLAGNDVSATVIAGAATVEGGSRVVLHQSESPLLHTIVPPGEAAAHGVDDGRYRGEQLEVDAHAVADVLGKAAAVGPIGLLKIDTEGTELDLLAGAPADALEPVRYLVAETSWRRDEAVEQRLRDLGYLVEADATFLRAWRP